MIRQIACRALAFFLFVLLSVAALAQTHPSQFSADLSVKSAQMSSTGKLYFAGSRVRMETAFMGHRSIVINDTQRKVAYMLMPDQHVYMEMSTENQNSRKAPGWHMYDAANPCANIPGSTCRKLGPGVANGRPCDKWLFTTRSGTTETVWIDQKSSIPIRSEMSDGTTVELTNIHEGPQSATLFEVPSGYSKLDMGAMTKR